MNNDRLDRIEKILNELAISQKETDAQLQRTDNQLQRTDNQLQRTDNQLQRTDHQLQRTDDQLQRTDDQLQRTDAHLQETDAMIKDLIASQKRTQAELSKEIKNVSKMVGEMTGGLGKFVEGLVEPRAIKLAKALGIKLGVIHRRVMGIYSVNGTEESREADIIIVGKREDKKTALVVEAKTSFEPNDMRYFLDWYKRFFDFFELYQDYEIIGVVAGGRFGEGVELNAQREGLFVLRPSHGIMRVLNPKDFKPVILRYN